MQVTYAYETVKGGIKCKSTVYGHKHVEGVCYSPIEPYLYVVNARCENCGQLAQFTWPSGPVKIFPYKGLDDSPMT